MGGGGSAGCRLGRDFAGGSSHRLVAAHDHGWTEGSGTFGEESACRCSTRAVSVWWAPDTDSIRSGLAGGPGAVDRSCHARRPHVSVALDLQKYGQVGRGTDATKAPRLGSHGRDAAEADWLQLAGQPQVARGLVAPGPQCSVRVHQPAGEGVSETATTCCLGGHEEVGPISGSAPFLSIRRALRGEAAILMSSSN